MKKSLLFFAAFILLLSSAACGNKKNKTQEAAAEVVTTYDVDNLLEKAEDLVGQTITVEGVCTHICQHGGKKLFLMGSDDTKTIRVEANEEIGSFKEEVTNSIVTVEGKLVEDRIDEAYLAKWQESLKQQEEKHGEDGKGCSTEQKARNEKQANSVEERIENFRKRIAERNEKEGKNYLSFYHIEATKYVIAE